MIVRHPYDPRIEAGIEKALWHADPNFEAVMKDLIEQTKPDHIVETGSHYGWTCAWFAENYPETPITTIELTDHYYGFARENLAPYENVECIQGSSADVLDRMYGREKLSQVELPFFWLDAHWWKPVPLREECRILSQLDRYVIVIDDFECKDPDFAGDGGEETFGFKMCNLEYVAEWLGKKCWRPNYPSLPHHKGYGIFTKGVEWVPNAFVKEDVLP
jgi:hypothetical protein